jgi:hypothetical protein
MNWLQIRLFGPYLSSFPTNSYGYYSQMSQNLFSNGQIFASALLIRQAARQIFKYLHISTPQEICDMGGLSRFEECFLAIHSILGQLNPRQHAVSVLIAFTFGVVVIFCKRMIFY